MSVRIALGQDLQACQETSTHAPSVFCSRTKKTLQPCARFSRFVSPKWDSSPLCRSLKVIVNAASQGDQRRPKNRQCGVAFVSMAIAHDEHRSTTLIVIRALAANMETIGSNQEDRSTKTNATAAVKAERSQAPLHSPNKKRKASTSVD